MKINLDGAIFPYLGKAGLGVVIRDQQGNAIALLSKQTPFSFLFDIVEELATTRAISFAQELDLTSFILEGDSSIVINSLISDANSFSPFGHILSSAKSTLNAYNCISFSHVRRLGNKVAHNLVKYAKHVGVLSVWMEDILSHVNSILFADLADPFDFY